MTTGPILAATGINGRMSSSIYWKARRCFSRTPGKRGFRRACMRASKRAGPHLEDRGKDDETVILDVEDRGSAEEVISPNDDFKAAVGPNGGWHFTRADGSFL